MTQLNTTIKMKWWKIYTWIGRATSVCNSLTTKENVPEVWLLYKCGLLITVPWFITTVTPTVWSKCSQEFCKYRTSMSWILKKMGAYKTRSWVRLTKKETTFGFPNILMGFTDWWIYALRPAWLFKPTTEVKTLTNILVLSKRNKI